jgi:hypothetical protein
MNRAHRRLALRLIAPGAAVITVGVIARADAPPGQYDPFNRADTVITDAKTGLNWQRTVMTSTNFVGAVIACSGLSLGNFPTNWRLPSYKELLTLVDESPHAEYPTGAPVWIAIDPYAFPETPVDNPYWTSSVVPSGGSVFTVEFKAGNGGTSPVSAMLYVRCVNDGM